MLYVCYLVAKNSQLNVKTVDSYKKFIKSTDEHKNMLKTSTRLHKSSF